MSRCVFILAAILGLFTAAAHAETGGGLDRAVRIVPREPSPDAEDRAQTLPPAPQFRNAVEFKLEILPGQTVTVGSMISFRISGAKAGYVIIVDVDATGKLTQIYPNIMSVENVDTSAAASNRIAGGVPIVIPPAGSKVYQFVAEPPRGIGMIVAIFSEMPLDVIDLPDVPAQLAGSAEAAGFVRDAAASLRIVPDDGKGAFQEPKLSFQAAYYAIR